MAARIAVTVALAMSAVQPATALPVQEVKFIVGGESVKIGEFPSVVVILLNGKQDCGGTLLNANTILTAAHCGGGDVTDRQVRAGSLEWASGGTLVNVSSAIIHPQYNYSNFDNDIAVWKLATPIEESLNIRYSKLPDQDSDPTAKSVVTVLGWGDTEESGQKSATLLQVSVPIVDRLTCQEAYQDKTSPSPVTNNMFCAGLKEGKKDSCQGDSGGPIFDATTGGLLGIVSWGQGCARPDAYGVYTRLGNFVDFVKSKL